MIGIINSPIGLLDLYEVAIKAGVIIVLIVQGVLIKYETGKFRYLILGGSYILTLYLGQYFSAAVRCINDGALDGRMKLADAVLRRTGSHFMGHIISVSLVYLPILWLTNFLILEFIYPYHTEKSVLLKIADITALTLPLQHIFNRLGCLFRGCCYGIPYEGILSMELPNNKDIDFRVFPNHFFEILCMVVLFVFAAIMHREGKHVFGIVLIGFSVTFFISEFLTANPAAVKHLHLTYIQFFCLAEGFAGVLYYKFGIDQKE